MTRRLNNSYLHFSHPVNCKETIMPNIDLMSDDAVDDTALVAAIENAESALTEQE